MENRVKFKLVRSPLKAYNIDTFDVPPDFERFENHSYSVFVHHIYYLVSIGVLFQTLWTK